MMWNTSLDTQPESGTMVEVSHRGDRYKMWYDSGLWFVEDKTVYCYYIPEYWRNI